MNQKFIRSSLDLDLVSRFGSREDRMEVVEAFERFKYRIQNMGMSICY